VLILQLHRKWLIAEAYCRWHKACVVVSCRNMVAIVAS